MSFFDADRVFVRNRSAISRGWSLTSAPLYAPDLTDDELQAAIDRAQTKRRELAVSQPVSGAARILTVLPKAAEMYRLQVIAGLKGDDPEATAKARSMLLDLIGIVTIKAEAGGEVWASSKHSQLCS